MFLLNSHEILWYEIFVTISLFILAILWYRIIVSTTSSGGATSLPGPRGLPVVGYLPFIRHDLHKQFTQMSRTYGPIFKVHLGSTVHVVINTMDLAKVVVREQDEIFSNRSSPIAAITATYGQDLIWSNNNMHWRELRKIFVHEVLSNKNLEACSAYRKDEVRRTIKNVYGRIGTPININEISFSTEANVLTSMIWKNTSVKGEEDRDLVDEFQLIINDIMEIVAQPNVSDLFPSLARFDIQGIELKTKTQRNKFDRIFTKIIEDRIEFNSKSLEDNTLEHDGKKDFLQILLDLKEQKNVTSFNITQIKALFMDIMIAGTDTTTALIEWAMTEIMQHHGVMKRIQEELEDVIGLNNIVEESHLPKLQYLDAVIKETLRLHPVAPFLIPRSPSKSCVVGGYTIPKGCTILLNVWAIHRDPQYWNNPPEFNPQRFLENKLDYRGNNLHFFPFGSGRRLCPGISLGEKMTMYVLASLMHSFEWNLPNGGEHDISDKFGIILKKRKPLIVIPSQRLSKMSLYK